MTGVLVEIPGIKWEKQRKLGLDKGFSDSLRDYARARWPHHTAKYVAREWDLTLDEGRGIVGGSASKTTIEKALKRAGPIVAVPVLEEVLGVSLTAFFRQQLINSVREQAEAEHHEELASVAWARLSGASDPARDDRANDASARMGAGEVGADAPRNAARSP